MQLFDTVNVIGTTPDNASVLEIVRVHDHNEIFTPGIPFYKFSCFILVCFIFTSFLGLSHDDIVLLSNTFKSFQTLPVHHTSVPRVHDVTHGFVSDSILVLVWCFLVFLSYIIFSSRLHALFDTWLIISELLVSCKIPLIAWNSLLDWSWIVLLFKVKCTPLVTISMSMVL